MDIAFKMTSQPTPSSLRAALTDSIQTALDRFRHRLKRIEVYVEDVNGPRGGIDKECRFIAELHHMPSIVIREQAESVRKAVGLATNRAKRILREKMNHQSKLRAGR